MVKTSTKTYTDSFVKTRINVIDDQFEMFLRCAGMNDNEVDKFLESVEKHELSALGIYIQQDGYRIAEVSLEVDWEEHKQISHISGDIFDTDLPGWREGVAPEAYVSVSRLSKVAKESNLPLSSWIIVSEEIRKFPNKHKEVCDKLGYKYNSSAVPWKDSPITRVRSIEGLQEVKVISRTIL